jgi:endoglucanase
MRYTINESLVEWDGTWSHIHVPLAEFEEQGCWDGEWHNPVGAYDWSAVDRFEIVAEHHSCVANHFWFDNIFVNNIDTARVWDDTVIPYINTIQEKEIDLPEIKAFPNPFTEEINLEYTLRNESDIRICIYNVTGQLIYILLDENQSQGKNSIEWKGETTKGNLLKKGLYYCHFSTSNHHQVIKIVRL